MLKLVCEPEYVAEVFAFATQQGLLGQLTDQFHYLNHYAEPADKHSLDLKRCVLGRDTPYSFSFLMQRLRAATLHPSMVDRAAYLADDRNWQPWFNGGLIYQGPGLPADGSGPSFCVSLANGNGWFVHT